MSVHALFLILFTYFVGSGDVRLPAMKRKETRMLTKTAPDNDKGDSMSLPQISVPLKTKDLISVTDTNWIGRIIETSARRRRYLIKFMNANVTYKWMYDREFKKGML